MSWLETIVPTVVLLAVAFYLLLGVATVVTALLERRPVKFLAPIEADDPEWLKLGAITSDHAVSTNTDSDSNPYATNEGSSYHETQLRAGVRMGFTAPSLFKHKKGGIYQTYVALSVSGSRQILANLRWGTTAGIRSQATILYSELANGRFLVTSDRPIGMRTPGLVDELLLLDANFDQVLGRHEVRMRASGQEARAFDPENVLGEFEAIHEARARFSVASGEAYWVDAHQTEIRSTLAGAMKNYGRTFSTKHVDRSLMMPRS